MGVFSRLADIVNANLNAMLDKAEDPEKMLRLIIQEMEDTLVEVRSNSARVLADKKECQRRLNRIQAEADDWMAKAELALSKNREDLARAALLERERISSNAEAQKDALLQLDEQLERLSEEVVQLQDKLSDAKSRQQALLARRQTATSRLAVRKQLSSDKVGDTLRKLEQFERKVDDIEAAAEVHGSSETKSLEAELQQLAASERIDQQLEELRAKMTAKDHG